jgi:quercetin dioxygenase-like cupin family protein
VTSRTRTRIAALTVAVALPATAVGAYAAGAARQADPAPAVSRVQLAQVVDPVGGKGRTLGLSKVEIPARTALALHRHPGHQIAYIERGTLTYTVRTGVVSVYEGPADADPRLVRRIRAGQTGKVRAGQWVVERPGDVHFGANRGDGVVEITLATLFRNGAPASIAVDDGGH